MTTTVAIGFPWGRYHATPWGRHVNEAAIEFPPSPWRILRALYSTWKCRAPELDTEVVLELLNDLAVPPVFHLPEFVEAHTRHYMPDVAHLPGIKTGTDKVIDAFAVFERDADLFVTWPIDLSPSKREALGILAGLLPYLGRADSICGARLADPDEVPEGHMCLKPLEADDIADRVLRLLVPERPVEIGELIARTTDVRKARRLIPPGTFWQRYQAPACFEPPVVGPRRIQQRPTAIRWSFASPARPSVHAGVSVADVLRRACMGRFGKLTDGGTSELLSGKQADGTPLAGHRHAHYLAFDSDGDQRIDTLLAWAPDGFPEREVEAITGLRGLRGYEHVADFRPGRTALIAVGSVAEVVPELCGPARTWESMTPFAPARFPRRRQRWDEHTVAQVAQEIGWRGLPEPRKVELVPGGWLDFRRHRPTKERLAQARRATGVRLTFDLPVEGPIALGALSHFGLGVLAPIA